MPIGTGLPIRSFCAPSQQVAELVQQAQLVGDDPDSRNNLIGGEGKNVDRPHLDIAVRGLNSPHQRGEWPNVPPAHQEGDNDPAGSLYDVEDLHVQAGERLL